MDSNVNFKYYAFISYSHEDEEFAKRIQKKLTEYKLPSVIRKANPLLPDNVRPIFRDATNLTTGMLQETLNSELEHSKFLLVLCSPNSAKPNDENKHWVNNEVQHFIDIGRAEFIIPVIVGGEPHASNPAVECFCPALLSLPGGDELLGIDIRNSDKHKISFGKNIKRKLGIPDENDLEEKATVHIVAKMLGLDIDDLWDWNKKAQKRKAYARLFSAAAVFLMMLTIGLTVYFKRFHVYHEYYVDYVERAVQKDDGTDIEFIGLGKLSKKDIKGRYRHYKFFYQNGKLIKIVYENSAGIPKLLSGITESDIPMIQELKYDGKYLKEVIAKNESNSVINKCVYEQKGTVIDIKTKDGAPLGLRANTTSIKATDDIDILRDAANIKSLKLERDENGFVVKKMYFRSNGAEDVAKDADGVSGFEYVLDDIGRPVQIWYLGLVNNKFERQAAKNGIAGIFLEYDEDYNKCKIEYVNSAGKATYNGNALSGFTICFSEFEKGNLIKQSYLDASGKLCSNSEGIAYYVLDYDKFGNRVCTSTYDENGDLICTKDFYAILRQSYDSKGNPVEACFYDSNDQLCMTKDGYAIVKIKYTSKNQITEYDYYDSYGQPALCNGEYVKQTLSYNENGDLETICHFDENDNYCFDSEGCAKIKCIYDENHKIVKQCYYDDSELLAKSSDNVAMVFFDYEFGNLIWKKYFDENGEPVNNSQGICWEKNTYENSGLLKEVFYYDSNDNIIMHPDGYAGFELTYDKFGNMVTESFYKDDKKNLSDTQFGYAYAEYAYDNRGNETYIKLYNSKRQPLSPYCTLRFEYNDNNNKTKICFYDKNDKLTKNDDGYAQQINEYNERGQMIKQSFLDELGDYALFQNSHAIETVVYDDYGRIVETACYDAEGKLNNNTAPYSIKKLKYDSVGNQIEIAFYKNETELVCCEDGFAIQQIEYNKNNKPDKEMYFNEYKELINESEIVYEKNRAYVRTREYEQGKCVHEIYDYLDEGKKELFYKDEKLVRKITISADGTETETVYE